MRPLLLSLLLAAPAFAGDPACTPYLNKACWFAPGGYGQPTLFVYFRGHWNYTGDQEHPPADKGTLPAKLRMPAARKAFKDYKLFDLAASQNLLVIATGSSDVVITEDDIAAIVKESGLTPKDRVLAAHSGGYVGLQGSLKVLGPVNRIVMLDNFYFGKDLAEAVKKRVDAKTECAGFFTPHNKNRVDTVFKPVVGDVCKLDSYNANEHESRVGQCLPSYTTHFGCL